MSKCEMQACLRIGADAKTDWTNDSSETKSASHENNEQSERNFIFLVAMRLGETPVHIPNTMVKT